MPEILCIDRRGGIKDENGTYHGPFTPVRVSERYYQRRYLRSRMVYTVEDFDYHLDHVWKEKTIRQMARNAGLPHDGDLAGLKARLRSPGSVPPPAAVTDGEVSREDLVLALGEDAYNRVLSIVSKLHDGDVPRKKDDLYGLAQRLVDGEEE